MRYAALALWAVWVLTGFRQDAYDWRWEGIDVATKTLWGFAFLWPRVRDYASARERRLLPVEPALIDVLVLRRCLSHHHVLP